MINVLSINSVYKDPSYTTIFQPYAGIVPKVTSIFYYYGMQ